MADTPIAWADIDALFADMPDMETASAPDAAYQASEGTHPESFQDQLAGGVDFLESANPQMLDAPHPGMGAESGSMESGDPLGFYIDPALLALDPQPTATPADDERRSNQVLRDLLAKATEDNEELDDKVGILTLRLNQYEGPNSGDVVANLQRRIETMAEERRTAEVQNEGLHDLITERDEKIKALESQVASNASLEETMKRNNASTDETIKSQKDQLDRYIAAAQVGDKALRDYQMTIESYKEGEMKGNQTLQRNRQTIDELQAALDQQKKAADKFKTKAELQEMALQERNSNYNDLQNTLSERDALLDSRDKQIQTQKDRIRQLSGEVTQHLASIKMAEDEIIQQTNAAKEKEQRGGSHREQRRVLKAKAENLEVELDNTTAALDEARREIKALQVESREKGYTIQRLEESQGSYVKAYNENLTLQETLKGQDEDMRALKGDLQDLEEEIAKLRSRRGRGDGSSRSESSGEDEGERVPGVRGYTTLEGVLGEEDDDEDNDQGGEPASPAEATETGPAPEDEIEEVENVGGTADVGVQVDEEDVTRPAPIEPVERIVEVPTMVYCPWLWWKMPYQALMLLLAVVGFEGLPSVSAVFWKFVGLHLFAINWFLVKFFGRRIDAAPLSPRPRQLPHPAKVLMLLAWHLVVYVCIGLLLYLLALSMAERTMWLQANGLSRATLIGLRESLRQSPNFGNPIVRFTLRLAPKIMEFEKIAGRWLPGNRGVFG